MTSSQRAIVKDLNASDPKIVLAALKKSRKEGNSVIFKAILDTLKSTDEPTVESEIIAFLFDLKDESSITVLIDALEDDDMQYYWSFLVATFWQAAIDGSGHLDVFVKKAIEGDYMTTLEALTVIENFDSAFDEQLLQEMTMDLNMATEEEEDEDKKALLLSLVEVVQNLPIEGE